MGSKQSSKFVREARNLIRHSESKLYDLMNIAKTNQEKQQFLNSAVELLEKALEKLRGRSFT